MIDLVDGSVGAACVLASLEYLLNLLFRVHRHLFEGAFHVVVSEVSFEHLAIPSEEGALSLPLIVFVVTLVDFVSLLVEVDATSDPLVFLDGAEVDVSGASIKDPAFLTMELILVPRSFLEAAVVLDELANAVPRHLLLLAVVDIAVMVQDHAYVRRPPFFELTLINERIGHQKHSIFCVELIVFEASFVDPAVPHDHRAEDALVVVPLAVKDGAIAPHHLALAFSLAESELALVVRLLEFNTSL